MKILDFLKLLNDYVGFITLLVGSVAIWTYNKQKQDIKRKAAKFISKNFDHVYSAHTTEELVKCYELEGAPSHIKIKFLEDAPMSPLIFILRSFKTRDEYEAAKKKVGNILFEAANTFAGPPV